MPGTWTAEHKAAIARSWIARRARLNFWTRVDRRGPDECWPWTASRQTGGGYGVFTREGRTKYAHRAALEEAIGRPLAAGEFACHTCDNPPCCNPAHLFVGSALDNHRDMSRKGRNLAMRRWQCPDCGRALERFGGPITPRARCSDCRAIVGKVKRRRAYEKWRAVTPLKDPNWRSRKHETCFRGHSMDNAYVSPRGQRLCRACIAIRREARCDLRRRRLADPGLLDQVS